MAPSGPEGLAVPLSKSEGRGEERACGGRPVCCFVFGFETPVSYSGRSNVKQASWRPVWAWEERPGRTDSVEHDVIRNVCLVLPCLPQSC